MPLLTLELIHNKAPISANCAVTPFASTLLEGGAIVIGPISAQPTGSSDYIAIDGVRLKLASSPGTWSKDLSVRHSGDVFRVLDGATLTIVFITGQSELLADTAIHLK